MGFEVVARAHPPRRRRQAPEVHLFTREHRRAPGTIDARIRLTRPLMDALGWGSGQRLNVMVGTDENEGTLVLKPTKDGVFAIRKYDKSASSYTITSRSIPLPLGIQSKVRHEIQGGNLLVHYA